MTQSYKFCGLVACFLVLIGCGSDFEEDVDCSAECGGECALERDFEFEEYEASCSESGEETEFCGVSSSPDCVEPEFEIEETTVADIHAALNAGEISCEWLTQEYIERILWHDLYMSGSAPPLNSIVYLNEAALETARTLDDYQRCEEELSGPLHCAPFMVKTNYATKEVPLTNGSLALGETQPNFDAFSVERMRSSGGIMLATTTMDEFAMGANGISGRSGKTGNAYDRTLNSGGSSAGSAAGVASNFAIAGFGTDNCSSLTVPASYNDLFTMRSSHQLVSTAGIMPSNRLDAVAGPMTRTVEDLALFFDAVADFNPFYGPHCWEDMPREESYLDALDPDGLEGKRIGIMRHISDGDDGARDPFGGANQSVRDHYDAFFNELTELGAEVIDDVELDNLPMDRYGSGSGYDTDQFLEDTSGGPSSYAAICATEMYSHSVFESEDQCLNRAEQTANQLENNYESGIEKYRSNRAYVESVMDDLELDALVYPADSRGVPGAYYTGTNCIMPSVTGLPTSVVPSGHVGDLPVGMSFTARMFDEATLFEIAYAYEQATLHRRAPQMPELEGEAPLDIEAFNDLHLEIGLAAFEEVLRDDDRQDLTASVFADIARQVLEDNDLDALIE